MKSNQKQLKSKARDNSIQLKNNQLKDDGTKSKVLLKDALNKSIESYSNSFNTFTKNELKQLVTKEKETDFKKLSQKIFFDGFGFLKKYGTSYMFLKNLVANKISINRVNDDQRNFVFNLMKGYNVSSFFKKSEIKDFDNKNLYEKNKLKALEILLECERSTEGVKKFFPKKFQ